MNVLRSVRRDSGGPLPRLTLASGAALAALGSAALVGSCRSEPTGPSTVARALVIRSGDLQSAPAGSLLGEPLQVTVKDAANDPVSGIVVKFRVTRGAQTGTVLSDSIGVSGAEGVARVELRLGSALDTSVVEAFIADRESARVTFRSVATAPPGLASVAPASFAPGDTVTLRGARFASPAAANTVFFGSARGRVLGASGDSVLRVVVPPCVGSGQVEVRVRVGSVITPAVAGASAATGRVVDVAPLAGFTVSGTELGSCLQLPGDGATYLLIPQSASSSDGLKRIDYVLAATTAIAGDVGGLLAPAPVAPRAPVPMSLQQRLDAELRRREHELVAGGAAAADRQRIDLTPLVVPPPPPPLGSARSFQVLSDLAGTEFERVTARLRYAGAHILIYVDEGAPSGGLSEGELTRFGDLFDRTLYDVAVRAFGSESDIDRNGRVIVLMTPVVNALTPAAQCASSGFVTGFFYGIDVLPSQRNSNRGEVFYSMVPDEGGVRSCRQPKERVERLAPATFIHEFQHMISFNQHVLVRGGSEEALWLNEGLSHIAEELASKHFEERYPAPTGRTDPNQLFPDSSQGFIVPDLQNAYRYMSESAAHSVTTMSGSGSLAERGAGWLFVRWLGDQFGEEIFGRLVATRHTGVENVADKTGESFASLFGDFAIALHADSILGAERASVPRRQRFTSRQLRPLFERLASTSAPGVTRPWPIIPRALLPGRDLPGSILLGTMDFAVLMTAPGSGAHAIRLSRPPPDQGAFAPNDEVQLGVFRVR